MMHETTLQGYPIHPVLRPPQTAPNKNGQTTVFPTNGQLPFRFLQK